jgi:hypothetical protein
MTGHADLGPATVHVHGRRTWSGRGLSLLDERPPAFPADVRWGRLTRFDRCALGAAYAVNADSGGALTAAGMRAAAIIRASWSSADGAYDYLGRMNERYGGMFRNFAQMGGPSTFHYLAKCLGIRGYATLVADDPMQPDTAAIIEDVAQISDIDIIFDLRMHLRWPSMENKILRALSPETEEVEATLLTAQEAHG